MYDSLRGRDVRVFSRYDIKNYSPWNVFNYDDEVAASDKTEVQRFFLSFFFFLFTWFAWLRSNQFNETSLRHDKVVDIDVQYQNFFPDFYTIFTSIPKLDTVSSLSSK